MNDEIRSAAKNFPNEVIPDNILRFYDFLTNKPGGFLDYETISDCKYYLSALLNDNILDEFIPFYTDNGHACYSIWLNGVSEDLEQLPIMYNNTEGTYIICALDFKSFLTLISFNAMGQLAYGWKEYWADIKRGTPSDKPFFSANKLERNEERNSKHEDFKPFVELIADMGMSRADINPSDIIGNASAQYPDLIDYIRNKNGFKIDPGN